jgi:putative transposase
MVYTTQKVRLYPTPKQEKQLACIFGAGRWVWNELLKVQKERFETGEKHLSAFGMMALIKPMRQHEKSSWLQEIPFSVLRDSASRLDKAYKSFFKKQGGKPRFKHKDKTTPSATFLETLKVFPKGDGNGRLQLPKFIKKNTIKFRSGWDSPPSGGKLKTVTVTRNSIGQYFASLCYDLGERNVPTLPYDEDTTVGIDWGVKTFATLSNGNTIEKPKSVEALAPRIVKLQQKLARCEKGSNRRKRVRHKLAKLHIRQGNRRLDWLHKLTRQLVDENQVNCYAVEDLSVATRLQEAPSSLARKVQDSCPRMFREILGYKLASVGKTLLPINQWEASSKACSACDYVHNGLTLAEREWTCPSCGKKHDRDLNAARNIKKMALAGSSPTHKLPSSGGRLADTLPFADGFAEDMTELGSPDDEVSTLVSCVSSRKGASQVKRMLPSPKGCFGTERLG